ncbi:MAG: class I SAM-dependent methyltransferase [Actinomycetota bacterium]
MTNFFGPHSPYLRHPLLTAERTAGEVDQLVSILGLEQGHTVLDVGCGFGRHSLELARRGFQPTGLDPSETMIAAAEATAETERLNATFVVSRGEDGVPGGSDDMFDGAIALFTTLGQIGPDGTDNLALLATTAAALRPGGRFVLELPQRSAAVAALVAEERFGDAGNRTEIRRRFDGATSRILERFLVVTDGETREFDLAYRLLSADELTGYLCDAGFTNVTMAANLADLAGSIGRGGLSGTAGLGRDDATMYAAADVGR